MSNLFTPDRRALRNRYYKHRVWRRIRKIQLSKQPLCALCEKRGIQSVANTADHIDPLWESWNEFISGPFQSLCQKCHKEKTECEDLPKLIRKEKFEIRGEDL